MIFGLAFLGAILLNVEISEGRCGFYYHSWYKNMRWCGNAPLLTGDFNGDKRTDLLCHSRIKYISYAKKAGTFRKTDVYRRFPFCTHRGGQLLLGDFNGDGKKDMLCHDKRTGQKWISFANRRGYFTRVNWYRNMGWCNHRGAFLYLGDFNGDRRTDMMCHDRRTGYKWISLANRRGHFTGTSWHRNMRWCRHQSLFIADFNGDKRDDMMCHQRNGRIQYSLANCRGHFYGTTVTSRTRWCVPPGKLFVGDFNGDGKADLLCHGKRNGYKWISYTLANKRDARTNWHRNMRWCYHRGAQIHVGDFNADGLADMLCHDTLGRKWIAYGECY